jgi:DNA-binding GntR family transcriptional regulator
MKAVQREPLTVKAYYLIKEKIITLEFAPGEPLDEKRLVETFGLGRTPIREAQLKLEADNLVDIFPGRGVYVKQITLKGVRDLLHALLCLERSAIQLAVVNITPEQLSELKLVSTRIDQSIRQGASLDVTYLNGEFHRAIAKASGNDYLISYINKIRVEEQRLAFLCFSKDVSVHYPLKEHLQEASRQHLHLIEYLEARDAVRLEEELVKHNRLFQRRIFGYLEFYPLGDLKREHLSQKRSAL